MCPCHSEMTCGKKQGVTGHVKGQLRGLSTEAPSFSVCPSYPTLSASEGTVAGYLIFFLIFELVLEFLSSLLG